MVRPKSHPKVFEAQRAASSWDTASPARGGSKAFTARAMTHRSAEPERCWRLPHGVETRAPGAPGEVLQHPATGRPWQRTGETAQANQSPCARRYSDAAGGARPKERG